MKSIEDNRNKKFKKDIEKTNMEIEKSKLTEQMQTIIIPTPYDSDIYPKLPHVYHNNGRIRVVRPSETNERLTFAFNFSE